MHIGSRHDPGETGEGAARDPRVGALREAALPTPPGPAVASISVRQRARAVPTRNRSESLLGGLDLTPAAARFHTKP